MARVSAVPFTHKSGKACLSFTSIINKGTFRLECKLRRMQVKSKEFSTRNRSNMRRNIIIILRM